MPTQLDNAMKSKNMVIAFGGAVVAAAVWSIWGGDMFPAEPDPTGSPDTWTREEMRRWLSADQNNKPPLLFLGQRAASARATRQSYSAAPLFLGEAAPKLNQLQGGVRYQCPPISLESHPDHFDQLSPVVSPKQHHLHPLLKSIERSNEDDDDCSQNTPLRMVNIFIPFAIMAD
ncbi:hypothetical protein PT974_07292 [Cladobotryum mycophilum]|uniref:Uncharacterized protein n=1 Tax=Cladobotryum mycophilum TaxID=491253 RepID=A0ABR0SQ36_9HYPO